MRKRAFLLALAVVLATTPMLTACSDDDDDAPPGHTEERGGVFHAPKGIDCTLCHGANNSGGEGPACTNCHK